MQMVILRWSGALIQSVEDGGTDIHWAPYHGHCSPCLVQYDWIIKLEDSDRLQLEEELLIK